jgi:hypothetical protein
VTFSLAHGRDSQAGQGLTTQGLTSAQARFAQDHRAVPGERSLADERMNFFYREGTMLTRRWLVDEDGRVVQLDSFARTPRSELGL